MAASRKKATAVKRAKRAAPPRHSTAHRARAERLIDALLKMPGQAGALLDRVEGLVSSVQKSVSEYTKKHWGEKPKQGVMVYYAADPNAEDSLPVLGELVAVVYKTRKGGDDKPVEYEHEFGKPRPLLCWSPKQGGKLVIASPPGRSYTVTDRGIEG